MAPAPVRLDVFSGTGNTLRSARWLEQAAAESGRPAELRRITDEAPEAKPPQPGTLLAVMTPTHGFTTPWAVIKYAARLPRGRGCEAVAVATRAGLRWGAFELPGISGTCTYLIALLLVLKGYRVRGVHSANMPSNWYSLHPIQGPTAHARIVETSRIGVDRFAARILAGRRAWLSVSNVYELLFGLALLPISVLYLLVGRFVLAKLFFANGACDGCGTCAYVCPVEAIELDGPEATRRPFWTFDCESCMRCAAFCPNGAVEAGHSWGAVIGLVGSVPVSAMATALLVDLMPAVAPLGPLLDDLIYVVYFYPSLFVAYWIFSRALRFKPVNWLFTHTTLTHYWGRHRETGTRMKALTGAKRNRWARKKAGAGCEPPA